MTWDPDQLRRACASVAAQSQHVRIRTEAIPPYAAALRGRVGDNCRYPGEIAQREPVCAHWLTLDAVNFGSGWFPTLRKRPGLSGYRTIAAGLDARFEQHGPWSAGELSALQTRELAAVLGQDPEHELIGLFAASLRDLGTHVEAEHDASFAALLDSANGSAVALAGRLATWECFADVSQYDGLTLPFLKRAQIVCADLQRAGAARFDDLHRLTIFADNLVPHVLTLDGVLELSPSLQATIAAERLIPHGSAEEVELRACAVHACELLCAELGGPQRVSPAQLDAVLWERGGQPFYKASPRPRCRSRAY
jgi:Potential Queuosine, Q, salvage protein family